MRGRLTGLDGLRGIAAFSVFAHHLYMNVHEVSRGAAFLSVDFFFMLSGYVMARTYEDRWWGGASAAGFLRARLRRLWPTMAVGGLIGAVAAWMTYPVPVALPIMLNLAFIPYFVGPRVFPLNGPAWSIFFELAANLLHVLILRRLSPRALLAIAAVSAGLIVLGGFDIGLDVGSRPENFLFGLPRVLLSYSIGILLWRWWRDRPPFRIGAPLAFAAMPAFFLFTVAVDGLAWQANLLFIAIICPLIVAGGLQFSEASRWAGIAAVAGAMSFPLYAVHAPVMYLVKNLGGGWPVSAAMSLLVVGLFPSVRRSASQLRSLRGPLAPPDATGSRFA